MEEHRIMADPEKFIAALATCAVCGFLAFKAFQQNATPLAVFFTLVCAVFLYIMFLYGSTLRVNSEGIRKEFLFIPLKTVSWDDIVEVGVLGTKIFNGGAYKKKPGRRYIYFSEKELDGDTRFKMALEWPPLNGELFCIFTKDNYHHIEMQWGGTIEKYNAGDLYLE